MRRRQVFKQEPPPEVQTVFEAPNEAREPEAAPRRRGINAALAEPAVDVSGMIPTKSSRAQEDDRIIAFVRPEALAILEDARPILALPDKKRGKPPKNNQSA